MDYLNVLGLAPGCSEDDLKSVYRKLSIKYHPDKNNGSLEFEEKFKKIQEAYDALRANPKLMEKPSEVTSTIYPNVNKQYFGYILVEVPVSVEDVYVRNRKSIRVRRKRICSSCSGVGSSLGLDGVCSLCGGAGKVVNKAAKLMGITSDKCPECHGTGKKSAPPCQTCSGSGHIDEVTTIPYTVTEDQYELGVIVVRGVGDEYSSGKFGDVRIKLLKSSNEFLHIEGGIYRMSYNVTPAQVAIGDKVVIKIYGKPLNLNIDRYSDEAVIRDKRSDGRVRHIQVDLHQNIKNHTVEVKKLYEEILELERLETKGRVNKPYKSFQR